jgi:hypothetical protein
MGLLNYFRKILTIEDSYPKNTRPNNPNKDLYEIKKFWNTHKISYPPRMPDATIHEYYMYAKTLMLWWYSKGAELKYEFPTYITEGCNISNPVQFQDNLIKEKYIQPASLLSILQAYKMDELRILADSIGCVKKRKKDDLVNEIYKSLDNDSTQMLLSHSNTYELSEKGELFLQGNYDYVKLHKHSSYRISLYEFNQNRFIGNRKRTFEDTAFQIISTRVYNNCLNGYYQTMAYDFLSEYKVALDRNLDSVALEAYLKMIYIKTCCIDHVSCDYVSEYTLKYAFENYPFTIRMVLPITKMANWYNPMYIENIYSDSLLPPSLMPISIFKNMISEIIDSITFDFQKYNNYLRNRLEDYCSK